MTQPETDRDAAESSFTVRVSLPTDDVAAQRPELWTPQPALSGLNLRLRPDGPGRTTITLDVVAPDLWAALLLAMGAVTSAGHRAERIEALPAH